MVRFHWHVEQGYSAYMPPDGVSFSKDANVQHASCEIEASKKGLCSQLAPSASGVQSVPQVEYPFADPRAEGNVACHFDTPT